MTSRLHWAFLVDSIPFTRAVIAGETALGGSESSAIGLARALIARGHQVTLYAGQLAPEAVGTDAHGLMWAPLEIFREVNTHVEYDVAVAVRIFPFFGQNVRARLRILWNHDLLAAGPMQQAAMAVAWAYDRIAYVSEYHRQQWEGLLPELAPLGWVTRNGLDLALVPTDRTKDPNRIIHISRPERGLAPLLAMWPRIRAAHPHAVLQLCRYASEYDDQPGGWGDTCRAFDAQVAAVHQAVGGIEILGQLTKPQLYDALAQAAVLWYPGVATFAETSCLAAIEAQACGTPIVASARGALPETAPSATLLEGDAEHDQAYQDQSVAAVLELLDGCRSASVRYRTLQREGRQHAAQYAFELVAAEWARQVEAWFTERFEGHTIGVLRQLLQEDDHVAAKRVATRILGGHDHDASNRSSASARVEAYQALALCDRVIAGQEQEAEHYAANAVQDPLLEAEHSTRFKHVVPRFAGCLHVIDVACGNGAFAIALALAHPRVRVEGIDYAQGNIDRAREAAVRAGVAKRVTFHCRPVYDFARQALDPVWQEMCGGFDGLFCGEFIEHVGNIQTVIDGLEAVLESGATVVYTCPNGPWSEALPHGTPNRRGHVHHFHHDDVQAVWGPKVDLQVEYLAVGHTPRGHAIGNWIVQYVAVPGTHPAGARPLATRIQRTRPKATLSVGLIVKDGALDLPRCLSTVWPLADEIVVGDTGSTDDSKAIAAAFGARVLDLPALEDTPEGFAGARNAVLDACTGDWFLWIDADERLMHPQRLGKLLEGAVFRGYVLAQQHLYTSRPPMVDTPIRLFRRGPDIRFYGCIHEQPQQGGPNGDITPYLYPHDLQIVHLGYLSEESGLQKMLFRNLPLMRRDLEVFPDRDNGAALAVRDFVYLAKFETEQAGALTPQARHWLQLAIRLFLGSACARPAHRLHDFARPWYELALEQLGIGFDMAIALGGATGSMRGLPPIERARVQTMGEYKALVEIKTQQVIEQLTPVPYVTGPVVSSPGVTASEPVGATA